MSSTKLRISSIQLTLVNSQNQRFNHLLYNVMKTTTSLNNSRLFFKRRFGHIFSVHFKVYNGEQQGTNLAINEAQLVTTIMINVITKNKVN